MSASLSVQVLYQFQHSLEENKKRVIVTPVWNLSYTGIKKNLFTTRKNNVGWLPFYYFMIPYFLYKVIYMQFEVFRVDIWSESCPGDAVSIHEVSITEEDVKHVCGYLDDWEWVTAAGEVLLMFLSDSTDAHQGFSLYFEPIEKVSTAGMNHLMTVSVMSFIIIIYLIARFMGPTWGPSGADRTQVGPMLAPWTLLSGCLGSSYFPINRELSVLE